MTLAFKEIARQTWPIKNPEDIERNCLALWHGGIIEYTLLTKGRCDVLLPAWIVEVEGAKTALQGLSQLAGYQKSFPGMKLWLHVYDAMVPEKKKIYIREQASFFDAKVTFAEDMPWNQPRQQI